MPTIKKQAFEKDFYDFVTTVKKNELKEYLESPPAPRNTNILDWWAKTCHDVARMVFSIPASSATSERAFSDWRFIINKRHVSLSPDSIKKLLFI